MDRASTDLATESFSYSWLIEGEREFTTSLNEPGQSFDFDLPFQASDSGFALADEIFSDGRIVSVYTEKPKVESLNSLTASACFSPVSSCSLSTTKACKNQKWKWRQSSNKILQECLRLVKPLMGWKRKSSRVDDLERKASEVGSLHSHEASPRVSSAYSVQDFWHVRKAADRADLHSALRKVRSWNKSSQEQPRLSPSRPSYSCWDDEKSISEAILYCKRSIEK